jgi:hypothetical protein
VITLNPEKVSAAVERISQRDAALGSTLWQLAGQYSYTAMLSAIESCDTSPAVSKGARLA